MAHIGQSRPDSGLCFQANVLQRFKLFPFRSEADLHGPNCFLRTFMMLLDPVLGTWYSDKDLGIRVQGSGVRGLGTCSTILVNIPRRV